VRSFREIELFWCPIAENSRYTQPEEATPLFYLALSGFGKTRPSRKKFDAGPAWWGPRSHAPRVRGEVENCFDPLHRGPGHAGFPQSACRKSTLPVPRCWRCCRDARCSVIDDANFFRASRQELIVSVEPMNYAPPLAYVLRPKIHRVITLELPP